MPSNEHYEKILVVDDEEAIREVVSTLLQAQGYNCTVCPNGRAGLETFRNDTFDLVLSDIVMPEMDGLKLLSELRVLDPDVPVIWLRRCMIFPLPWRRFVQAPTIIF